MTATAQDAHPFVIYNARYRVVFPILDADGDLVSAAAGLDSEASQDMGTFADCTNEATEIATSSGVYYLDLVAGETDTVSTAIIVKTATAGAKTTVLAVNPVKLPVLRTGTAQAGAASTITLDSGASAQDDYYNGCYVNITNNSPVNAQGQARLITDYVGSTKVATITGTWGTTPSSASTFEILVPPSRAGVVEWAGKPVVDPSVAGLPEVDLTHIEGTAHASTQMRANAVQWAGAATATDDIALKATLAKGTDITGFNDLSAAQVNTEVDSALDTAIPGSPTANSINERMKTMDDNFTTAIYSYLSLMGNTYIESSVSDVAPAIGNFDGAAGLSGTDGFYNFSVLVFTGGALKGLARQISGYTGSTRNFAFSGTGENADAPWPVAPANNDAFVIIGRIGT